MFGGIALLGHADEHAHAHDSAGDGDAFEGLDAHALAHLGGGGQGPTIKEQAAALARPAVWAALLSTLLGYGGVFTSYVYIAPQLTDVTGLDEVWITPLLLLSGAGLFVGNMVGGKVADRDLRAAVLGSLALLAVVLFAMTFAVHGAVARS